MKTGEVARKFKRDPKTIKTKTDTYREFFTDDALREEDGKRTQRNYQRQDLEVLASIFQWEFEGDIPERIKAKLRDGDRVRVLPAEFNIIEGGDAVEVYSDLKTMQVILEQRDTRIQELQAMLDEKDNEIDEIRAHYERELMKLTDERATWRTRYEMLKEQFNNKDGAE